ncbi:MAG TPA: GAF domain-containing sensor histidine kinase [Gaiellales bacterium]|jgi:signal transduction histidine kinase|nr:GAF domain-containing sensor histidine kinase [Gaiellales bacterium]
MPVVFGSKGRRRRGRAIEVAVGTAAVSLAAIVALVIGLLAPVTRYYWIEAAVWGAAIITAGSVVASAAARLYDQRARAQRLVHMQSTVARALATAATLEETTGAMLRALGDSLGLGLAVAWRADPRDQRLRYVGSWSAPGVASEAFRIDSQGIEFERGQGVLGGVWERGTALATPVAGTGFRRQQLLEGLGFAGVVFVPIVREGVVTGVVECFTDDLEGVDQTLLDVIEQIGGQIGVAYDRAERVRELEEQEERRRHVLGALLRAEEDAKAQLASDLHDDTIQVMVAAQLALDRLERAMANGDPARTLPAVVAARQTIHAATERARHVMFQLRPQVLTERGLEAAVRGLLEDAAADGGFQFELTSTVERYPRALENLCYRVLQEAITNVRKHARARRVAVTMRQDAGAIVCEVSDDGVGFDPANALDRDRMRLHLGLESMRERVSVAGGTFDIRSAPDRGATFTFSFPLSAVAEPRQSPLVV